MKQNYDVIVVGAGPAGATLAYELAGRGVDVLIIDRATFPRHKCCGGGLTVKAVGLLGDDVKEVAENSITGALFSFAGADSYHGEYDRTLIYTVERSRLDHFLVLKAEKAGARFLQGVPVSHVYPGDRDIEVITGAGNFRSQVVVGADGSRSVVAGSLDLPANDCIVGIETEVMVDDEDLDRWKSRVMLGFGQVSDGYAWLFPKADRLSIGIASYRRKARGLKHAYWQFLKSLGLKHYVIDRWSAGIISVCTGTPVVARGRIALLGDAAGLADPLTGEGIYNAALSARLAAPAIESVLARRTPDLQPYQQSIEEMIMPEIRAARFFARIPRLIPGRLFNAVKLDSRIWNAACSLLRGETTYTAIENRVRSLGGLYRLLRFK